MSTAFHSLQNFHRSHDLGRSHMERDFPLDEAVIESEISHPNPFHHIG